MREKLVGMLSKLMMNTHFKNKNFKDKLST